MAGSAPEPAVTAVRSANEAPQRAAGRFQVPNFDLAELLVARGADSAQVSVGDGAPVSWADDEPYVPPKPFAFPWRILVVLPTFNERENLAQMTAAIARYLVTDILVVDDNSPDGTGALADELHAANESIQVLHRKSKDGLGAAYLAGFAWALERGYERILEMDCDFSHAPWDLPRLVHASANADLVIGSRYVPGGSTPGWSRRRRLLSRGGNIYASVLLGGGVHDWTAGYRCFSADCLRRLDLDDIRATGYGFQIEMAWAVRRAGGKVREVPVRFVDRAKGESKMHGGIAFEALRLVPGLRLRGLRR